MESKTDKRHREKTSKRAEKKRHALERQNAKYERDKKLKAVSDRYLPRIQKLQEEHQAELKKIWDDWKNLGDSIS